MAAQDEAEPTIIIKSSESEARPFRLREAPVPVELLSPAAIPTARAMPESEYSPALRQAVDRARPILRIRELRPGQAEVIESVLSGRDTLAIMPTGSGKSLTYQLPALSLPGPTLVVSPLLALIEDQVGKLKAAGVAVARIDSTRTAKERAADLEGVREGRIKLILITPESVCTPAVQDVLAGCEVFALLRGRSPLRVSVGP